ncbi:hypothetical protein BDM02DRAFT_3115729 [Thelephora ganbajun]|uniref:Uncharacterized protein n=1 Tax=Thelephora ganbajun TaxID=370292 RepID=A0ACB6ZFZ7_THEGA|nr:hypothetical protein BDM02DRAFT_3115729 [Thelephora ganbajun]
MASSSSRSLASVWQILAGGHAKSQGSINTTTSTCQRRKLTAFCTMSSKPCTLPQFWVRRQSGVNHPISHDVV